MQVGANSCTDGRQTILLDRYSVVYKNCPPNLVLRLVLSAKKTQKKAKNRVPCGSRGFFACTGKKFCMEFTSAPRASPAPHAVTHLCIAARTAAPSLARFVCFTGRRPLHLASYLMAVFLQKQHQLLILLLMLCNSVSLQLPMIKFNQKQLEAEMQMP